jgi:primary-amine oxidase
VSGTLYLIHSMLENLADSLNRPVEIHQVQLKPADFFAANPSIDVPSNKNLTSQLVKNGNCCAVDHSTASNGVGGTNGTTNGGEH